MSVSASRTVLKTDSTWPVKGLFHVCIVDKASMSKAGLKYVVFCSSNYKSVVEPGRTAHGAAAGSAGDGRHERNHHG